MMRSLSAGASPVSPRPCSLPAPIGRSAFSIRGLHAIALPRHRKEAGLQFVEDIRAVAGNTTLTLADQLSLLLDRTGYRAMLRESRAENMEQKLENLGELIDT